MATTTVSIRLDVEEAAFLMASMAKPGESRHTAAQRILKSTIAHWRTQPAHSGNDDPDEPPLAASLQLTEQKLTEELPTIVEEEVAAQVGQGIASLEQKLNEKLPTIVEEEVAARVGQAIGEAIASLEYKIEQLQARRDCTEWVQKLQLRVNDHDKLLKADDEWVKSVNSKIETLCHELNIKALTNPLLFVPSKGSPGQSGRNQK